MVALPGARLRFCLPERRRGPRSQAAFALPPLPPRDSTPYPFGRGESAGYSRASPRPPSPKNLHESRSPRRSTTPVRHRLGHHRVPSERAHHRRVPLAPRREGIARARARRGVASRLAGARGLRPRPIEHRLAHVAHDVLVVFRHRSFIRSSPDHASRRNVRERGRRERAHRRAQAEWRERLAELSDADLRDERSTRWPSRTSPSATW